MHDFLVSVRGADRVFLEICNLWPDADVFTPVYNEQGTEGRFAHRHIQTSFLQRLRPSARTFRALLPLYPTAIESFDLSGYDLVVSSSSAWAHAVVCDEQSVHVSYCHNPFRYAWNERHRTIAERGDPVSRAALRGLFRRWREWDWIAAQRVDRYITNSRTTQARISSYFGRDSQIVYPPVDVGRFRPGRVGAQLPDRLRARLAQADRHRSRGLQPPATAAGDCRRRPGTRPARAARGSHGQLRRACLGCAGGRPDGLLPRARRHGPGGVRDRGRRGTGGGAAGDRPGRRRPARERHRGRDGLLVGRRTRRACRGGRWTSIPVPSIHRSASRTRGASTRRSFGRRSAKRSTRLSATGQPNGSRRGHGCRACRSEDAGRYSSAAAEGRGAS